MDFGVVLQTDPPAREVVRLMKTAEDRGFTYGWTFDSVVLWQEPFVIYSQILANTSHLVVGPMVTNPSTRDWSVTASLFATLNDMYGNRTVCGIGRGDSARRVIGQKPANLATFATKAESLGYSSLWTFHRLLVPAAPELDPVYRSVLDPLVAMSYMAARTSTIRLGVALVNFPFVSPTYLAKQASTLDVVSSGRLDLGLGAGWQQEEFIATGASMERRGARIAEYVDVLRNLWTAEVSTYSGTFYQVPPSRMAPKPVQPG
ncbi:LLM class flavin-dependent oxidoreductase, partial [Kibdelosporangium lantanae]